MYISPVKQVHHSVYSDAKLYKNAFFFTHRKHSLQTATCHAAAKSQSAFHGGQLINIYRVHFQRMQILWLPIPNKLAHIA